MKCAPFGEKNVASNIGFLSLAEFQNNIFTFDQSINSWTQLAAVGTLPSGRERMGFTSTPDGLIYMFGGYSGGKF